jgi:ABC-2 type transport system ATP-binding protein
MLETLGVSSQEQLTTTVAEEPVIAAENFHHSYDGKNFALKDVTFTVNRGEVFGLLGKNGAGKTTLIKILTTLIRPSSGRLSVLGRDAGGDGKEIRKRIGVVQQGESFDYTSVQRNFDIYGILWGIPRAERVGRRENLIAAFGLETVRKRRAFDLSGGEKRRLQVAREMMHDMEILFLDEPTVGLDVIMRRKLLDMIRREVQKGLTVVFTTHNLEEADYLCDRIAVIDSGRILALDTVENLKKLYGGKKTVEATIGNGGGKRFFQLLEERLGPRSFRTGENENSALILTENPKEVLQVIVELSQTTGSQIEWLNVRSNTLEDVFINSVSGGA